MADKAVMFDMTDERKEKFKRESFQIVGLLKAEFTSPLEAYAVVKMLQETLAVAYGIKGSKTYSNEDTAHA